MEYGEERGRGGNGEEVGGTGRRGVEGTGRREVGRERGGRGGDGEEGGGEGTGRSLVGGTERRGVERERGGGWQGDGMKSRRVTTVRGHSRQTASQWEIQGCSRVVDTEAGIYLSSK